MVSINPLSSPTLSGLINGNFNSLSVDDLSVSTTSSLGNAQGTSLSTTGNLNCTNQVTCAKTWVNGSLEADTHVVAGIYEGLRGTGNYRIKTVNSTATVNDKPSLDFARTTEAYRGRVEYDHSSDSLNVFTGGSSTSALSVANGITSVPHAPQ